MKVDETNFRQLSSTFCNCNLLQFETRFCQIYWQGLEHLRGCAAAVVKNISHHKTTDIKLATPETDVHKLIASTACLILLVAGNHMALQRRQNLFSQHDL